MKKDVSNILIITTLAGFILIMCILDKHFYQDNKKQMEQFENNNYKKFNETIVPDSFLQKKEQGNLDQCKKNCDDDSSCVGFTRENKDDSGNAECNLIYNIDGCFNENKKPYDTFNLAPNMSTDYQNYDTYLKKNDIETFNIHKNKCLELNNIVSLKHTKYPFDFLFQNSDGKLIMNKVENSDLDTEKVKAIFKIVKGLTGSGISFLINKNGEDHYLVNSTGNEEVKLEQKQTGGQFNKDASFEINDEYSSKSNLFSIRKMVGNRDLYWKINQTNKKLIMVNVDELGSDKTPILFEIVDSLIDTFDVKPLEVPAPSPEKENIPTEEDLTLEKQQELEKLELEIRETQHKQNMKLMNVMLDVNKFKLMDLSMSDYLRKCNQNSADEMIDVIGDNNV